MTTKKGTTCRFRTRFALPLAALFLSACAGEHRDWAFVQAVGGMAFGTPYRAAGGVMLPVAVDVSGLKTITTTPRLMNSGLALKEIVVKRKGNSLYVALVTTVISKTYDRTTSSDVPLGNLEPGRYAVMYAEPSGASIDVGEITVAP